MTMPYTRPGGERRPAIYKPRIFVVAGHRYEPEWLVDEFRANMAWADEVVIVDDRDRTGELWVNEARYRRMQRQALIDAGIRVWDWVCVTSPDERWSADAGRIIRRLISQRRKVIYEFPLREMFSPTQYRTDGMWSHKWRPRLFPFLKGQRFTRKRIQTVPCPVGPGYIRQRVPDPVIYHTENVLPASRIERALVYEAMSPGSAVRAGKSPHWVRHDPTRRYMRRFGFAYLADNRQPPMKLERIPAGAFDPPIEEPYLFCVPDELLVAQCGRTRAELMRWLTATLGRSEAQLMAR